jgi:hypothetical protein
MEGQTLKKVKHGRQGEGGYTLVQLQERLTKSEFCSEKELVDFIEKNIIETVESLLGERYLSHKREWRFGLKAHNILTGGYIGLPRIDLVIETNNGRRIGIECKNPIQIFSENSKVVSQLLSYIILAEQAKMPFNRTILLTTKVNANIIDVIKRFNLPIEILVISRTFGALWQNNGKTN